jgi:hypothetical protein
MTQRHRRRQAAKVAALAALLALAVPASATYGGYEDPGYDPGGGGGGGYEPGGGDGATGGSGHVQFELTAKKKQHSLKAVKAKATCENRACTVDAKGKLRAGEDKAKLKPDEETLAAGVTDRLKLKLPKRARKAARSAVRDDEKLTVKVTGEARGVGGGGSAKDAVRIKLTL